MLNAGTVAQALNPVPDRSQAAATAPIRIAIVVSHPIQYFAPWHRAVAALPGVELKVFFCRDWGTNTYFDRDFRIDIKWDIPLLDGYSWEFLAERKSAAFLPFFSVDNPSVGQALAGFNPAVVLIHGYSHRTMWRTVRWCNQNGVPVMMSSDSNGSAKRSVWKRIVKSAVVGHFYRHLDGAYSTGENNRIYHQQYGIPGSRLFNGTMPIDCDRLVRSTGEELTAREEIRRRYRIPGDAFVVIFAGKLIALKCIPHLLEAAQRCVRNGLNIWCLLVGEGPERLPIEEFIRSQAMNQAILTGFINQSEIGKYYAASDAIALMSWREAKGVPVAEAGVFGCPAILCDRIGCIGLTDSARPNENALVYPWSNIEALAGCISRLAMDKPLYESMSSSARRIARAQDVSIAAAQLKEAAIRLRAMGRRNRNSGGLICQ